MTSDSYMEGKNNAVLFCNACDIEASWFFTEIIIIIKKLIRFLSVVHFIAPQGYLIKLDFRDYFLIEPSEDCKFDMLEVSPV